MGGAEEGCEATSEGVWCAVMYWKSILYIHIYLPVTIDVVTDMKSQTSSFDSRIQSRLDRLA